MTTGHEKINNGKTADENLALMKSAPLYNRLGALTGKSLAELKNLRDDYKQYTDAVATWKTQVSQTQWGLDHNDKLIDDIGYSIADLDVAIKKAGG
jgi:hypothetical protein